MSVSVCVDQLAAQCKVGQSALFITGIVSRRGVIVMFKGLCLCFDTRIGMLRRMRMREEQHILPFLLFELRKREQTKTTVQYSIIYCINK